jgi:hypothetical protein
MESSSGTAMADGLGMASNHTSETLGMLGSPSPMVDDPTYTLGLKVADSIEVRRKQISQSGSLDTPRSAATSNNTTNATPHGGKIQSKLLVPGTVYTTPTKFTPFKPYDLYPQTHKVSDRVLAREDIQIPKTNEPQSSVLSSRDSKIISTESNLTSGPLKGGPKWGQLWYTHYPQVQDPQFTAKVMPL